MDLKHAQVVNFYNVTNKANGPGNKLLKVPHYQRPYCWTPDFVTRLINDFFENSNKNSGEDYFSGALVTVWEGDDAAPHELVDGQQRITTLYLTVFLKFLVSRVLLREALTSKKTVKVIEQIDLLQENMNYLFNVEGSAVIKLAGFLKEIKDKYDDLDDEEQEEIVDNYLAISFLPTASAQAEYKIEYIDKLQQFLSKCSLNLQYNREKHNKDFKDALSSLVVQMSSQQIPIIDFADDIKPESLQNTYIRAMEAAFKEFKTRVVEKHPSLINKPIDFASKLVTEINGFVNGVKVCVIQTGDTEDAYSLFEVLNDRAMSLSDLDLIKNQFFKYFCICNNGNVDSQIDTLEKIWSEYVFQDTGQAESTLIAYFAASFITGKSEIKAEVGRYREAFQQYLKNKYESTGTYNYEEILADFNVFKCVKATLKSLKLGYRLRNQKALQVEHDLDLGRFVKTFHYLMTVNQTGVAASLMNVLLGYIQIKDPTFGDEKKHNNIRENIIKGKDVNYNYLNSASQVLWQTSIYNSSASKVKEKANFLIEQVNKFTIENNNWNPNSQLPISVVPNELTMFEDWLKNWKYGQSQNCFKSKIIFLKLLRARLNPDSGKLELNKFALSASEDDIASIHLDHLEPGEIRPESPQLYFKDDDRDTFINELGNMMVIPGKENISKGNKPLETVFDTLKELGLGDTWLASTLEEQFFSNCENDNGAHVPTATFFRVRKKFLIEKIIEVSSL